MAASDAPAGPRRRPRTPLQWLAARVVLGPRALRWGTTAALLASILIVLGGGVVRVTGSGLGCPSWPTCTADSLTPIPELGIHGFIEFANRTLTGVLIVAVGLAIIAATLQRPRDRMLTRLAWSQFWLVVANAVAGGITVIVSLNPWMVALHFVLAVALLATATLTWHRALDPGTLAGRDPGGRLQRALAWTLLAASFVLIVAGTLVSGSGPHSGDSSDVPRMGLDWTVVAWLHGGIGTLVLALAIALLVVLPRRDPRRRGARLRTGMLIAVLLGQGAIGLVQSLIGLPELLVALHILGAALVWVGALRVLLDVDPTLFARGSLERRSSRAIATPVPSASAESSL